MKSKSVYILWILVFLFSFKLALATQLLSIEKITPYGTYLNIADNLYVSSSNVGIGTSNPSSSYKLDVNGNTIIRGTLDMNSHKITNLAAPTNNNDAATKAYVDSMTSGGIPSGSEGQILRNNDGTWENTSMIYITDDGKVGIGTTNPSEKLDIVGRITAKSSDYIDISVNQTDSGKITMGVTNATAQGFLNIQGNGAYSGKGILKFLIEGSERVRIDNSGNVGIGTTSPGDTLDVNGDVRVRGGDIKDSNGNARITFSGTNVIISVG